MYEIFSKPAKRSIGYEASLQCYASKTFNYLDILQFFTQKRDIYLAAVSRMAHNRQR